MFSSPTCSMMVSVTAAVFLATTSNVAIGQESAGRADTTGVGVGFALGKSGDADRAEFQLRSPELFRRDGNGAFAGRYSLVGSLGTFGFRNMVLEDETNLGWAHASYGTFGLRVDIPDASGEHQYYATYEAMYVDPSKDLYEKAALWGGRATFGVEFIMPKRQNLFGQELTPSLFVQGDINLGFEPSDKLPGRPDLFNGVGLWVGSRTYF